MLDRVRVGGIRRQVTQRPRALERERERARKRAGGARAEPQRRPGALLPALYTVSSVTRPQLVATVAGERDRDEFTRRLRTVVSGHGGRVGERLVEMPGELGQQRLDVRRDRARMELAPEVLSD